jgi:hypothetical protein
MRTAVKLRVTDCITDCVRLGIPKPAERQHVADIDIDKTVEPISRGEFFNRSTSILIAAAGIALEPSIFDRPSQSSGTCHESVMKN